MKHYAAAVGAFVCCLYLSPASMGKQVNILFLLTEDQGAHLSLVGTPGLQTPNVDSLARSGVYFRNAFVAYPVCSASKAAIYTGLHNHTNGILNNTHNFHKPAAAVSPAEKNSWLAKKNRVRDGCLTLTEILRANGYYQGVTHKLHVLPNEKFPYDEFLRGSPGEIAQFIRNAVNKEQPWFLMANIPQSHRPYPNSDQQAIRVHPDEVELPTFLPDTAAVRKDWTEYLAAIEQADEMVGKMLEVLERSGQSERTIVIFMSDHGPSFQHGKMTLYDLGLRVPLAFRGPGIKRLGVINDLVSELDLLPTILDFCGVEKPFDYTLHGRSIHELLTANKLTSGRKLVFAEISNRGPIPNEGIQERSVFDGRWKLIYRERTETSWRQVNADSREFQPWRNRSYRETIGAKDRFPEAFRVLAEMDPQHLGGIVQPVELYDLDDDPYEMRDLASSTRHARQRRRLVQVLQSWAVETNDDSIDLIRAE